MDPALVLPDSPDRHGVALTKVEVLLEPGNQRAGFHVRVIHAFLDREPVQLLGRLARFRLDVVDVRLK